MLYNVNGLLFGQVFINFSFHDIDAKSLTASLWQLSLNYFMVQVTLMQKAPQGLVFFQNVIHTVDFTHFLVFYQV